MKTCTRSAHRGCPRFRALLPSETLAVMPWPIVRRVAAAAAVSATSLAVLVVGVPAVSTGRPWLTALDRCALAALLVGAVLQWAVPRPDLVWLISGTAIAIACFATAGRPGRAGSKR